MVGIKSLFRGLKAEDEAVRMDTEANARLLYGGTDAEAAIKSTAEAEEMEIMSGRDVTVNHHHNYPAPVQTPATEAKPVAAPATSSTLGKTLTTAAVLAGGIATGYGAPAAIEAAKEWITPEPTVITQPAEPRGVIGIELGEPE